MPELPEVETMCRGIAPIVGRRVARIERTPCRRRPICIRPRVDSFRRRVEGKTIVGVQRLGKRVVIWLATGDKGQRTRGSKQRTAVNGRQAVGEEAIIIEPRMTGLVLLADPPTREHLRFRMQLAVDRAAGNGEPARELLFWDRRGLGSVRLLSAAEFALQFASGDGNTLGPDALGLSADELRQRLHRTRRPVKVALLDQRAIAGVGNLYASEILHAAGIHPTVAAIGCEPTTGDECTRPWSACSRKPFATKVPRWPTALIATR